MTRIFLTILASALTLTSLQATVRAEAQRGPYDARRDRLEGFDKDELARLDPLLSRGPVALVEFADTDADQLPAINVAVLVDASPRMLETVVTNPADYARFMPALDEVDVVGKHDNVIVYDWSFDLAVLQLSGRNVMTVYSAPVDRPDQTTRVTIDSENGDLGRGRFLMRIVPHSAGRSVLVLSMRLDLREANYVARQLAKAARSVNRSANLALAISMALHIEREAERRAGVREVVQVAQPLAKPEADAKQLWPLLNRGDLLLLGMRGEQLEQIGVLAAIGAKRDKVHAALSDARAFGAALIPGSVAEVVAQDAGVTTFDWDINLPLVGLSGRMRMTSADPVLTIDATAGALNGGSWRFELTPVNKHTTLVTGWARFDFKKSTWLLEKMVSADTYVGHGMSAASEVMLVRALRSRATKH